MSFKSDNFDSNEKDDQQSGDGYRDDESDDQEQQPTVISAVGNGIQLINCSDRECNKSWYASDNSNTEECFNCSQNSPNKSVNFEVENENDTEELCQPTICISATTSSVWLSPILLFETK